MTESRLEEEIPLRHWHLNDPGVIPNMLQTGAGSPSGICVYEGRLLPKRFWDQIIHCDPGPNVVRAYPATPDGAGYSATIDPLVTGTIDKWFRPADVCVAPDGSLFVTDWYDPGVGGHRQGDTDRGRLFRIAPPGVQYKVPKFDYSTAKGAVEAIRNPNLAVRYKAWMALHDMGRSAENELLELYGDPNPRLRARALWLLGKIEGRGQHYVAQALADDERGHSHHRNPAGTTTRLVRRRSPAHRLPMTNRQPFGVSWRWPSLRRICEPCRQSGQSSRSRTTARIVGTWKHSD